MLIEVSVLEAQYNSGDNLLPAEFELQFRPSCKKF
jgi:hypothetical protein